MAEAKIDAGEMAKSIGWNPWRDNVLSVGTNLGMVWQLNVQTGGYALYC